MIVSGGENIYPREVEEVLYRCPGVREAAVVGLPDPKWGAVVTAFVVKATRLSPRRRSTPFAAASDLASFKRPRRIIFADSLPINPSGKVLNATDQSYSQGAAS
jgi:fatty-acyl-CoA synthase